MSLIQYSVEFGIIKDYPEALVNYEGDGETGVVIVIEAAHGSASGIRINNQTREEYIIIDDSKIQSIFGSGITKNDEIIIDTTKGNKSATLTRDGVTKSILNAINRSSKWIQLQTGMNQLTATATNGFNNLRISIRYTNRVLGV